MSALSERKGATFAIDSTEQRERIKNPHWKEEISKLLDETFKDGEERLRETVMSDNHEDPDLDVGVSDLKMIRQDVVMERNVSRGMDNYVASNSFCLNRLLYRGWWSEEDQLIHWLLRVGPGAVGPPGGAHGGALAAVLDQFAGYVSVPHGWCVTGELKVTYKSIVPLEEIVYVESKIVKTKGRTIVVRMTIHSLPSLVSDEKLIKTAEAAGSQVRKLKNPIKGHSHYIISPAKTIAEAIMIKIPNYKGGRTLQSLPPGFSSAYTLGFELPKARL